MNFLWNNETYETSSLKIKFNNLESSLNRSNLLSRISLNAPTPLLEFGRCGRIMKSSAIVMTMQDPASQRLMWKNNPTSVLVIKKVRDVSVLEPFVKLVRWLIEVKWMDVFVEESVLDEQQLTNNQEFGVIKEKLSTFHYLKDDITDKIDFIICLGGDGTLLYASMLFQQSVPPVMAFHLGSLGFLTPFHFDNFQEEVTLLLEGNAPLTLRSRLRCVLHRKTSSVRSSPCKSTVMVLNEVVIDRGPSPYISNVNLYFDDKYITSVQGDGLIISTSTGSTAYALSAGAPMVHPSVSAIMITPICPHSLSFRPIVVPAGVEVRLSLAYNSRNTAWVSFDGRNRQEILHGDNLIINMSIYPVPSISAHDQITDWFGSLGQCLHWNERKKQTSFTDFTDVSNTSATIADEVETLGKENQSSL